jgi:4-amino-4-deoxy-L-arabinose transferase-like glycosyltransferase
MRKSIASIEFNSDRAILAGIIIISIAIHLVWLMLDRSVPSWDDASHLTNALNYQRVLDRVQPFSSDWWRELWAQSPSYTAPFIYILTVPFLNIFGKSVDSGILVNLIFIITIACTTYALGKTVFSSQISLWAAGLCLMFPALLNVQMMYLLDDGIVAITCLTFWFLTLWKNADTKAKSWQWSLIFGISFGCLMLSKPTGFLFLTFPSIFLLARFIKHRNWWGILQFAIAIVISWSIYGGWFGQNWLTIITSAVAANGMGKMEGDPGANTWEGWVYYIRMLPEFVSLPILVTFLGLLVLGIWKKNQDFYVQIKTMPSLWLILYFLGGYFFCSLATNKDSRFILPILPVLSIFIAYGINLFQTTWAKRLRWIMVGVTGIILVVNLFWIPGTDNLLKLPYIGYPLIHRTDTSSNFPHQQLIQAIAKEQPYLQSNIGVLASARTLNSENLNLYGSLADFQVYARYFVNSRTKDPSLIAKDLKYLNWYVTKTGDLGYVDPGLLSAIEQHPRIKLYQTWAMPDQTLVKLYQRQDLPISVLPIAEVSDRVKLERVIVSPSSDLAVNTTYQLSGDRDSLQHGLLLLTWQSKDQTWYHDRGIGLGELYLRHSKFRNFRITENSAMLPPSPSPLQEYQLTATYLDQRTGQTYPLPVPNIEIRSSVDNTFPPNAIAQLSKLGKLFAQGKIDAVFSQLSVLNQYDPVQDYLNQAQAAIKYRLQQVQPDLEDQGKSQIELRYTLALIQAVQRQVRPLLDNLTQLAQTDSQNPYAWIYLGFVRLYNWQPQAAEIAFQIADKLPSPPPELATLKIVSSVLRLDLVQAWQRWQQQS